MQSEVRNLIESALDEIRMISREIAVVVVANVKPPSDINAVHEPFCAVTEYLSENEASQLLIGLQESGFYTKFFDGEDRFICSVVEGKFAGLPRALKIVYSIAQSGSGPGRKSLVPAFCQLAQIPVCNSDAYVASLARHKFHVYCILRNWSIPVAESWLFDSSEGWLFGRVPPPDVKLIAKACYESASIGLTMDTVGFLTADFAAAIRKQSLALRQPVIVQRFVPGYEVEVPVLAVDVRPIVLEPVSITLDASPLLGDQILDYACVFSDQYGFKESTFLSERTREALRSTALAVCRAIGIDVVGRVDFRLSADESFFVTDVATSPHLTKHSSYCFAFERLGFSHAELMGAVVAINARRYGWI